MKKIIKKLPDKSMGKLIKANFDSSQSIDHYELYNFTGNCFDDTAHTALTYAVRTGDLELVRDLLAAGADPDAKDGTLRFTPVMWAASCGYDRILECLIDYGADLNYEIIRNKTTINALSLAEKLKSGWGGYGSLWYNANRCFGYSDADRCVSLLMSSKPKLGI